MMISIPDSDTDVTLDREDGEAIGRSVTEQYGSIAYLLHLPNISRLGAVDDTERQAAIEEVVQNLAQLVFRTRNRISGTSINVLELEEQIGNEVDAEVARTTPSTPEGTTQHAMEEQGVSVAEALLKVIYRTIEKRDILQMIDELPASIQVPDGSRTWQSVGVAIGGVNRDVSIDLTQYPWSRGGVQQLRTFLVGKRQDQIRGLTMNPPIATPLTEVEVNELLNNSVTQVVDPELPIGTQDFADVPAADLRCYVNTHYMLNRLPQMPPLATLDRAGLEAHFVANLGDFNEFVQVVDQDGAAQGVAAADVPVILDELFAALNRDPALPFAARNSALGAAIESRSAIDDLVSRTVDNRSLLLALSTLQQDPDAADAITDNAKVRGLIEARTNLENDQSIRTALDKLQTIKQPRIENPARTIGVIRAEIAALPPPPTAAAYKTWNDQKTTLEAEAEAITESVEAIRVLHTFYNSAPFGPAGTPATEATARAAELAVFLDPDDLVNQKHSYNASNVIQSCTRTFNAHSGRVLRSASYYTEELDKNAEQIQKAQGETLGGKEPAWAVIRRGLENRGITGDALDNTVQYMRNQVQETPEAHRDADELARDAYYYDGDENNEANTEWNDQHGYRSLWFGRRSGDLEEYQENLFSPQLLGFGMEQLREGNGRRIPLPRLIDAYFRMKYLSEELSTDDPRHLPATQQNREILREMHKAILFRAQLSMTNASAMSDAELDEFGIQPNMTITQRMQAAHAYLMNPQKYYTKRKGDIERIADRAYRPIEQRKEGHDRAVARLNYAKNWPVDRFKNTFTGGGPWYEVNAVPAKVVKNTWKGSRWFLRYMNEEIS